MLLWFPADTIFQPSNPWRLPPHCEFCLCSWGNSILSLKQRNLPFPEVSISLICGAWLILTNFHFLIWAWWIEVIWGGQFDSIAARWRAWLLVKGTYGNIMPSRPHHSCWGKVEMKCSAGERWLPMLCSYSLTVHHFIGHCEPIWHPQCMYLSLM